MQNITEQEKSVVSLQAQAFVRTFQILNEAKKDEALDQLVSALDNRQRELLQSMLKPLINYGITVDDTRVHYVIVPIPLLKPEMIADFVNDAYATGGGDYFGHPDNIELMFISFVGENGHTIPLYQIGRAIAVGANELPPQTEESKQLVAKLLAKDAEMNSNGHRTDFRFSVGLCFKIDPTGIWKPLPEPGLVPKEQQTGLPLAMTRYCVDLCREGKHCFKNSGDQADLDLKLLQFNRVKYHHLDVEIGTQTRRVVYLQPDATQSSV